MILFIENNFYCLIPWFLREIERIFHYVWGWGEEQSCNHKPKQWLIWTRTEKFLKSKITWQGFSSFPLCFLHGEEKELPACFPLTIHCCLPNTGTLKRAAIKSMPSPGSRPVIFWAYFSFNSNHSWLFYDGDHFSCCQVLPHQFKTQTHFHACLGYSSVGKDMFCISEDLDSTP